MDSSPWTRSSTSRVSSLHTGLILFLRRRLRHCLNTHRQRVEGARQASKVPLGLQRSLSEVY